MPISPPIRKTDAAIPGGVFFHTITLSAPSLIGHQLVLQVVAAIPSNAVFVNAVSDDIGNNWRRLDFRVSESLDLELWGMPGSGSPNSAQPVHTVTVFFNQSTQQGGVVRITEYSGLDTPSGLAANHSATGAGTAADTGAATPSGDHIAIAAIGASDAATMVSAQSGGFTLQNPDLPTGTSPAGVVLDTAYLIASGATAVDFGATLGSSSSLATPSLVVSWNAAVRLNVPTPVTGATGYRWFRGGVLMATTIGTNYFDSGANWGSTMDPGTLYSYTVQAFSATNQSAQSSAQTITTPSPLSTQGALTTQAQVTAASGTDTFWGGIANEQIILKAHQKWTNGEVTGSFSAGSQRGALEMTHGGADSGTLVNVNVHGVPNAFAAIYLPGSGSSDIFEILGGRAAGAGSLGIGPSGSTTLTRLVEIAGNGVSSPNCGFEAGGIKGVGAFTVNECHVHDNICKGIWSDLWAQPVVTNNLVENNSGEGIFIEISHDHVVTGNTCRGNGFGGGLHSQENGWLWNGGITISSTPGGEVAFNTLSDNYNGITAVQQSRNESPNSTSHCLTNLNVHDNIIHGSSRAGASNKSGATADSGGQTYGAANCGSANLSNPGRNNVFTNNVYDQGMTFVGITP